MKPGSSVRFLLGFMLVSHWSPVLQDPSTRHETSGHLRLGIHEVPTVHRGLSTAFDDPVPELVLSAVRRIGVEHRGVPRALAMTDDAVIWALFKTSERISRIDQRGTFVDVGAPDDTGFTLLTHLSDTLFAARRHDVWRYDARGNRFERVGALTDTLRGPISSIAMTPRHWWVVLWMNQTSHLVVNPRMGKTQRVSRDRFTRSLEDAAVLHADGAGHVVLTSLHAPYTVARLDTLGVVSWSAQPSKDPRLASSNLPLPSTAFATAGLPLGNDRVLQLITDLRSDSRWLALYSDGEAIPARVRRLSIPFGLTQASIGPKLILGFDDTPQRREIVLYRWKWMKSL